MTSVAAQPVGDFTTALSARQPTPGGGAAAAVAAALGCAAGAMAARYTTGTKYAAIETESLALGQLLEHAAQDCLRLGDADVAAYAAVTSARKNKDQTALAKANADALAIPVELLANCAQHAAALAAFLTDCNPYLISDVKVGVHLLAGAGRAAWQTILINQPDEHVRAVAAAHCKALDEAEARCLESA